VRGRIVGVITATVTLIVLVFVALGLFTSLAGLLMAGIIAFVAGTGVGALVAPGHLRRVAAAVAGYIAIITLAYVLLGQAIGRYAPPGAQDGPGVMPPR
jgi:hypothetical protein